jgi:hypothetical protein
MTKQFSWFCLLFRVALWMGGSGKLNLPALSKSASRVAMIFSVVAFDRQ